MSDISKLIAAQRKSGYENLPAGLHVVQPASAAIVPTKSSPEGELVIRVREVDGSRTFSAFGNIDHNKLCKAAEVDLETLVTRASSGRSRSKFTINLVEERGYVNLA